MGERVTTLAARRVRERFVSMPYKLFGRRLDLITGVDEEAFADLGRVNFPGHMFALDCEVGVTRPEVHGIATGVGDSDTTLQDGGHLIPRIRDLERALGAFPNAGNDRCRHGAIIHAAGLLRIAVQDRRPGFCQGRPWFETGL